METRKGGNGRGSFHTNHLHGNGHGSIQTNYLHGNPVTSMLSPIHKQGYLGDLEEKSKPELDELLERQERMLKNKKFLDRLPDKGEKIKNFVKTLQDLIAKRENEIEKGNMRESVTKREEGTMREEEEMPGLEEIATDDRSSRMELGDVIELPHERELKIIERGFDQLNIHEGPHYQVVVKAEERNHKSKFALNRPHKTNNEGTESSTNKPTHPHTKDLTSASVHDPEHGAATVISVEECRELYSEQQKILQEQRAEQLADRVMRRMRVAPQRLEHPEGKYRPKDERINEENVFDPDQEYLDSVD